MDSGRTHSTVHSVAQLTKYINSKTDLSRPTLVTFIDFRKAFDCVQHPVLVDKLAGLEIDRGSLDWFRSYLSNRKQKVLANGVYSTSLHITQGVPQGSVLGPLFYISYANDLAKSFKHCKVVQYADDTALYISGVNFGSSVQKMQKDLTVLSKWCNDNGVAANTDKTKIMLFGGSKVSP